jgi:hypothetical protein
MGLSSREAQEKLRQYGQNDPTRVRHGAALSELFALIPCPNVVIDFFFAVCVPFSRQS